MLLGAPIGHRPMLARIGYLPENHRFPRYLTGRQVLEFFAALAKVDRPTRRRRSAELIELVGMQDAADRRIATYSKGMMQRIGLAHALVNDPQLLVLDEPTDGVDPVGRRDIRQVLAELRRQGKTVFINSHQLSELEMICDRVAILLAGQVARQGTLDELTVAKQRYEIEFAPDDPQRIEQAVKRVIPDGWISAFASTNARPVILAMPQALARTIHRGHLPSGVWIELEAGTFRIGTTDAAQIQDLLDAFRRAGLTLARVQSVRPSLEELFMDTVDVRPAVSTLPGPVPSTGAA